MALDCSDRITLDLTPGKVMPVCHASQFDEGRIIRIDLTNDGQPYNIKSTDSFTLNVRKPDGTVVTRSVVRDPQTQDTYVYISTTQQMTAVAGENICELKLDDGDGNTMGTMNFYMQVEQSPLDGGVQSASAIHDLETQIENIIDDDIKLTDLSDVYESSTPDPTTGITNGATIIYNTTDNKWHPSFTPVAFNLGDLDDVNISNDAHAGEVLTIDNNGNWVNATPGALSVAHLTDIGDVVQDGSLTGGQVLQYDADRDVWFNGGRLVYYLRQLYDVMVSAPSDGEILVWVDDNDQWENMPISYNILPDCNPTWSITPADDLNKVWVWKYDPLSHETGWTNDFITFDSISSIVVDSNTIGTDSVLFYDGGTGKWENHYIQLGGLSRSSNISDIQVDTSHVSTGQVLAYNATTDKWVSKNLESTDIRYIELTGTLTAGSTSITLSDQTLPNNPISVISTKTLDFYTDIYGVNPTSVSVADKDPTDPTTSNTVTITFEAQSSDMNVKVRIS